MDFIQERKTENLPKRESLPQKKRFLLRTPVGKWVIDAESRVIRDTSELTRWSRKETTTVLNIIESVQWYLRKHGFLRLCKLALIRLRSKVKNNKQVVFVCDLKDHQPVRNEMLSNLTVANYKSLENIPNNELAQLIGLKSEAILLRFLRSFFNRGATLWLAKVGPNIAGLQWTLVGGFKGFYSMPIPQNDAIVLSVEVFSEYRGKGIWPAMTGLIYSRLKDRGIARVYTKVGAGNPSSLRSITKTNAKRVGMVRTFSVFGKFITIWDKVMPDSSKYHQDTDIPTNTTMVSIMEYRRRSMDSI